MRFLLDTHTFLWWVADDQQLSNMVRDILRDPLNRIFLSPISAWEIAIKAGTGKLSLPEPPKIYVPSRMISNQIESLPVEMAHALETQDLPLHHKDPFDRILIAQAIVEKMPLLTADAAFAAYPVQTIW